MPKIKSIKKNILIKVKAGEKAYPTLENLEVIPSGQEQIFTHPNSYGYDEVKVRAVESDEITVTPTEEQQQYLGLYGEVNVKPIPEEYKTARVENETLILSRVSVSGEVLNI